jgi:bifunctional non-homologous end joining protein LigD
MVNIGCVDINPWSSRYTDPETPDYLVIDLDPSEENRTDKGLNRLRETAMAAKEYCDKIGLKTFIKTSGKTGMHFLVPCRGFSFTQARDLTEHICSEIHQLVPAISTTATSISQRENKVYIDPSQNDYADTIAAAYCARPYYKPCVSTPLDPKEINATLDPHEFTIETIFTRLRKKGDLFKDLLSKKMYEANNKILKKL